MVRYGLFVLVVLGSAATAIAAIAPDVTIPMSGRNVTVIEKNQAFPVLGPIVVQDCRTDDCSEATG